MNAAILRKMRDMGLTLDQAIELADEWEASIARDLPSAGALRQRRYRQRKSVTRDVTRDVSLPETKVSPAPPSKTQTILTPSPPKGGSVPTKLAFDTFWLAYPRKIGKADARKAFDRAWRKLPPFEEELILSGGLERAKAAWTDPQFIPHAATWLNGERWADEPEVPKKAELSPFAKWQIATGRA